MSDNDPGVKGKKLSKSDSDVARQQENNLLNKYWDAQIAWLNDPTEENKDRYRMLARQYNAQYDHR